jgi:Tol biopolymer transport system component
VLLADPGLRGAVRLADGRMIYSIVADPLWNRSASLWETNTDAQTGKPTGKPRRIRDWVGNVSLWRFSSTADGTRVAFVKMTPQRDVYVADLAADGRLERPRRLTLDDSEDFPTNWSADSKAVLFSSDRNGNFDIFRQSLDQRTAEAIVSGPDDEMGPPAVSPDGAWLYYLVEPKGWRSNLLRRQTIARSPAAGGPHQTVLGPGFNWPQCARAPSTVCVVVEREANHLDVYALDPSQGKGRKIATTETGSSAWSSSALSPDGSHLAVLMPAEGQIRILSLHGDASRDVPIKGRPLDSTPFYWSAEGTGWYLSSTSFARTAGSDLLMVDLNCQVRVLWHQAVPQETGAIPSPDGRHLAITHTTSVSNVWMIKDF